MICSKNKKLLNILINLLLFSVLYLFAIYACSILHFDSDKANHLLQAKDIANGNVFLKDWILTGASFLTTDLIYYLIGFSIGGISLKSIYISAGLMVGTALLVGYVYSVIGRNPRIESRLLYFLAIGIPSIGLMYHFRVHTGALTIILLCFILFYEIVQRKISKYYCFLLILLMILGVFGDLLIAIECCLPITLYSVYQLAICQEDKRKLFVNYVWIPIISIVFGLVAQKAYIKIGGAELNSYILSKRNFTSVSLWPDKIHKFIKDLLFIFGADFTGHSINDLKFSIKVIAFILLIICIIVTLVLINKIIKKSEIDILSFLLIISIFLSASAYIFSDMSEARYITIIPLGLIIILVRNVGLVFDYFKNKKYISIVIMITVLIISFDNSYDVFAKNVPHYYNIQNYSLDSLDSNYEVLGFLKEHNLKCGYASFWNASVFTVLSEEDIRVRHIDYSEDRFEIKRWFSKSEWYKEEAYFILINTNGIGDGLFFNNADSSIRYFGEPVEQYNVSGYIILVYDYDLSKLLGT